MDERRLVEAYAAGDERAFEDIVRAHTPELLRHAVRRLHDQRAAEDAVQETFLRAYRNLGRFNGQYRLAAWLHRICDNVCTDEARRRQRQGRLVEKVGAQPADDEQGAEDQVVLRLPDPRLRSALSELAEPYREALVLRYVDQLPYRDVATRTGVSEENARARVHRARASLRQALTAVGAAVAWMLAPFRKQDRASAQAVASPPGTVASGPPGQVASRAAGQAASSVASSGAEGAVGQAATSAVAQAAQATAQAAPQAATQALASGASQALASGASHVAGSAASQVAGSVSQVAGSAVPHAVGQASQAVGYLAPEVVGQVSSMVPAVSQVVAHASSAPAGASVVAKVAAAAAAAFLPIVVTTETPSSPPIPEVVATADERDLPFGAPAAEPGAPTAAPEDRRDAEPDASAVPVPGLPSVVTADGAEGQASTPPPSATEPPVALDVRPGGEDDDPEPTAGPGPHVGASGAPTGPGEELAEPSPTTTASLAPEPASTVPSTSAPAAPASPEFTPAEAAAVAGDVVATVDDLIDDALEGVPASPDVPPTTGAPGSDVTTAPDAPVAPTTPTATTPTPAAPDALTPTSASASTAPVPAEPATTAAAATTPTTAAAPTAAPTTPVVESTAVPGSSPASAAPATARDGTSP